MHNFNKRIIVYYFLSILILSVGVYLFSLYNNTLFRRDLYHASLDFNSLFDGVIFAVIISTCVFAFLSLLLYARFARDKYPKPFPRIFLYGLLMALLSSATPWINGFNDCRELCGLGILFLSVPIAGIGIVISLLIAMAFKYNPKNINATFRRQ